MSVRGWAAIGGFVAGHNIAAAGRGTPMLSETFDVFRRQHPVLAHLVAFVVTGVVAIGFVVLALMTVVAVGRWAFNVTPDAHELLRALASWATSFVLTQGWSYYLRHAPAP